MPKGTNNARCENRKVVFLTIERGVLMGVVEIARGSRGDFHLQHILLLDHHVVLHEVTKHGQSSLIAFIIS
jgi:hypothetical protein